jgi:hypothetical protein
VVVRFGSRSLYGEPPEAVIAEDEARAFVEKLAIQRFSPPQLSIPPEWRLSCFIGADQVAISSRYSAESSVKVRLHRVRSSNPDIAWEDCV